MGKFTMKGGKEIIPRGRCPSCNHLQTVSNHMWYRAARPRCQACGDWLVPGTAHTAQHYDIKDSGMSGAAEAERLSFLRQIGNGGKGRAHPCWISGCATRVPTNYTLCALHTKALQAIDHRLYMRIKGRFRVFHDLRWKVHPKALSMWRILLASAAKKLKTLEPPPHSPTIEGVVPQQSSDPSLSLTSESGPSQKQ